jgi:hypothetical protein
MKAYGEVDVESHIFLTSEIFEGESSASRSGHVNPGKKLNDVHWIGGRLGPSAGLDGIEN